MLTMSQINHIKDLSSCGYRISEISEKTGSDPKTIRKYLSQDDFSPVPPIAQENPSKLDPFKPVIQAVSYTHLAAAVQAQGSRLRSIWAPGT